ncbi:hypothetical protein V8G54_021166 [Vigna mungo]|uniref:Uncharacterized protein n=1 Tax=Vigna mungo TaxID=3915 RepID=A0AAQ3NDH2_VIGMU
MAASSSCPGKCSVSAMREANPSEWISDDNVRERFLGLRIFKKGLDTFTQMKGDCYPELVKVFYNNFKEVDDNVHSRVKGADIVINNGIWLKITGLKDEGRLSHQPDCLQNKRTRKTEIKANLIGKATLTCIGLKRTAPGWFSVMRETLFDSDSNKEFPPSNSEFERCVGDRFENASKRINILKKSLTTLNEKMDEIFKHYVDCSTSSEESKREMLMK